MFAFLLVAVLHFTVPTMQADTSRFANGCDAGALHSRVAAVRLYRVRCYQAWQRDFIRQKPEQGGAADTMRVDDSACMTYFLTVIDSSGKESCQAGITVGIPPTGVGPTPSRATEVLYDVQGRRAFPPLRSGWYCSRNGKWVRVK